MDPAVCLGLTTVYHIDSFTVAIYDGPHCTIGDLRKFELYMATV
jgi:hypothetical protein